jgi:hypothetical protein
MSSAHLILTTLLVLKCSDTIFIILIPLLCDFLHLLPLAALHYFFLTFLLVLISPTSILSSTTIFTDTFNFRYTKVDGQDNLSISLGCISCLIPPSVSPCVHFLDTPACCWYVFPLTGAPVANLTYFLYNKNLHHDFLHYDTTQFGRYIPVLRTNILTASTYKHLYLKVQASCVSKTLVPAH